MRSASHRSQLRPTLVAMWIVGLARAPLGVWTNIENGTWSETYPSARNGAKSRLCGRGPVCARGGDTARSSFFVRLLGRGAMF